MRAWNLDATDEAREYLDEIALEMFMIFSIPMEEAQGRMERFWSGRDLVRPMAVSLLLHRDLEYWAKTVYYGRESSWWISEDGLEPLPYP